MAREGKDVSDNKAKAIAHRFLQWQFRSQPDQAQVVKNGTRIQRQGRDQCRPRLRLAVWIRDWPVTAAATADIAYSSYEIALVLDTTGSMKGGKLASMKDAVLGLIGTMSVQVTDTDKLKFAVVPFAAFVNVGPNYGPSFDDEGKQIAGTGASWLDLRANRRCRRRSSDAGASRFQLYTNLGRPGRAAWKRAIRPARTIDVDDTPPDPAKPETLFIRRSASTSPTRRFRQQLHQLRRQAQGQGLAKKKKRWAKYGVATRRSGSPLLGG